MTSIFLFVLAEGARRYGVQVHAFCVMSNHVHLVVTDPGARLPEFNQFVDAFLARAVNALLGRWESFWAPSSYSAVRLVSPEDVIEKVAYVLANPVRAGLVRSARIWPGAWSDPRCVGAAPIRAERPRHFFSRKSSMPDVVELRLVAPPGFSSAEEFKALVIDAFREHEARARQHVSGCFAGVARVLAQNPFARPRSVEPRRNMKPRVAARDKWQRIQALMASKAFVRAYRDARAAWRTGVADVVFPVGTYLLRVAYGVNCAAPT